MDFSKTLEKILKEIEYQGRYIRVRHSAYDWDFAHMEVLFTNHLFGCLQYVTGENFTILKDREEKIKLTICEALLNSYGHGCESREDLFVEATIYFGNKSCIMHIKDDGFGFDHKKQIKDIKKILKNYSEKELSKFEKFIFSSATRDWDKFYEESKIKGLGLYLLLRYVNSFDYNEKGNELLMRFNLTN